MMMWELLGKDNDFITGIHIPAHTHMHMYTAVKTDISREKTPSVFMAVPHTCWWLWAAQH